MSNSGLVCIGSFTYSDFLKYMICIQAGHEKVKYRLVYTVFKTHIDICLLIPQLSISSYLTRQVLKIHAQIFRVIAMSAK